MKKMKSNGKKIPKSKSKPYQILIIIVIIAFVVLMLSDLFRTKKNTIPTGKHLTEQVYKFTKEGELTFQSIEGKFIDTIEIEFAENDHERTQGLMYRTDMKENQGMLFVFPYEEPQSFWMKNTVLSLDMFFINSSFKIVTIHKNTKPYSDKSYQSTEPAQYVLETTSGYANKHGIEAGDHVVFRKTN